MLTRPEHYRHQYKDKELIRYSLPHKWVDITDKSMKKILIDILEELKDGSLLIKM